MSSDNLSGIILGTFLTLFVLVVLLFVLRAVRTRLFPSENEEERSEAMTELLLLQARLQERAVEKPALGGHEEREGEGAGGSGRVGDSKGIPGDQGGGRLPS